MSMDQEKKIFVPTMTPEQMKEMHEKKGEIAASLIAIKGHPLETLTRENEVLSRLLENAKNGNTDLEKIREIVIHYAKKGDLIYPLLKEKYEIAGPSDLMWTTDDEIRDEISSLLKSDSSENDFDERLSVVLKRAGEMIYKENKILFPMCAVQFSEDDWKGIYQDSKDYDICLDIEPGIWEDGEKYRNDSSEGVDGARDEIVMAGGHMTVEQLTAMLNTIPMEISFVDADNINRYFNEGHKVFKRPSMAIDREVFSCHPPKIEIMVRSIIDDFRNGTRDKVPVWMNKGGRTMLVTYMAVRDKGGKYLGTLELVQDMEFVKEHFGLE
ncbi:PAS domain-containing protein [Butyrivibrio sp. AE3004]|uniref:PAS domain-containing protein n=1 Tax=Butyrivibrio sp. AE3004 TaxID=1506994 RepID=UPI000A602FEE|nr:PAS domain-containing protein [Butyrivibrio sp. AE3004]